MSCKHWTLEHHSVRRSDGSRSWRCSCCGTIGPWSESWSYYGSMECKRCWMADIEWVACSAACAELLRSGKATPIAEEFPVARVLEFRRPGEQR